MRFLPAAWLPPLSPLSAEVAFAAEQVLSSSTFRSHILCHQPSLISGAVELRNAVATRFSLDLPATATFDYPTPAALAAYVHSQMPEAVATDSSDVQEAEPGFGWGMARPAGRRGQRAHQRSAAAQKAPQRAALPAILEQLEAVAAGVLGAAPPPEQPLMEAGLDSLGEWGRGGRPQGMRAQPRLLEC